MSLQEKIANAEHSDWLTRGIPRWKVKWIIWWAQFKVKLWRLVR